MGNMSSTSDSYTYNTSSGGNNFNYNNLTSKYIDAYATGNSYLDQTAYNRAILGDATGEIVSLSNSNGGWYSDYSHFVDSSSSWFARGAYFNDGAGAGIFTVIKNNGSYSADVSSRAILAIK